LGRAPDAAGLAYWVGQLADSETSNGTSGTNRYQLLALFAISPENQLKIEALAPGSGYLIVPDVTGGYADTSVPFPLQTVLNAAASGHFLDTYLIDTTDLTTMTVGGITVSGTDTVGDINAKDTIVLSPTFKTLTISGAGDTVSGPSSGGMLITDTGGSTNIYLSGTGNVVNYAPGDSISGWQVGADHLSSATTVPVLYAPTPSAKLAGTSLNQSMVNIVDIGAITITGTVNETAAAAAAANLVYTPAGTAGETVWFLAQSGSDTALLKWVNASTPTSTVTAAELTAEVTLIGVTATTLTATDFHS
jgi:hypothetical protein